MTLTEAEEKSVNSNGVDVEENGCNAVGAKGDHEHRHHVVVKRWYVFIKVCHSMTEDVKPLRAHSRHDKQFSQEQ
jgi:hypothetical protein